MDFLFQSAFLKCYKYRIIWTIFKNSMACISLYQFQEWLINLLSKRKKSSVWEPDYSKLLNYCKSLFADSLPISRVDDFCHLVFCLSITSKHNTIWDQEPCSHFDLANICHINSISTLLSFCLYLLHDYVIHAASLWFALSTRGKEISLIGIS